jgi:3'-5' exoribonuclease
MFQQLPQNQPVSIIVAVSDVTEKTTKTGKKYHSVTFIARDQSRQSVNFWDGGPPPPPIGSVVKLRATWGTSDFGLEAKNIAILDPGQDEIAAFADCFIRPEAQHAKEIILSFIESKVIDPVLRSMLEWLWATHGTSYQRAAAARANHQPYSGGLMEHTAAMLLFAESICQAFNQPSGQVFYKTPINSSLIYTAIIFHDCGKIWENNYTPAAIPCHMPYSRIAEYHGHIAIGHALIVEAYQSRIIATTRPPFQEMPDIVHHLCHCILSHHGQLEWGSPIEPKTLEAHLIHSIDNIEAKNWMHANNLRAGAPLPDSLHKNHGPIRMTIATLPQDSPSSP